MTMRMDDDRFKMPKARGKPPGPKTRAKRLSTADLASKVAMWAGGLDVVPVEIPLHVMVNELRQRIKAGEPDALKWANQQPDRVELLKGAPQQVRFEGLSTNASPVEGKSAKLVWSDEPSPESRPRGLGAPVSDADTTPLAQVPQAALDAAHEARDAQNALAEGLAEPLYHDPKGTQSSPNREKALAVDENCKHLSPSADIIPGTELSHSDTPNGIHVDGESGFRKEHLKFSGDISVAPLSQNETSDYPWAHSPGVVAPGSRVIVSKARQCGVTEKVRAAERQLLEDAAKISENNSSGELSQNDTPRKHVDSSGVRGRPAGSIEDHEKIAGKVSELAYEGATKRYIARECGITVKALRERFREQYQAGRDRMKYELIKHQIKTAKGDGKSSATMLVWLGKNLLGQKDREEVTHKGDVKITTTTQMILSAGRKFVPTELGMRVDVEPVKELEEPPSESEKEKSDE